MTDQYVPGSCNIGPAEVAMRRRVGHTGLAVTAALAGALLRSDRHPAWRLALALPAAGAAAGYLQARQRFCANYGYRGVYNFDRLGHEQPVEGDQALALDRRRSRQIAATSAAIGLGVALASMAVEVSGSGPPAPPGAGRGRRRPGGPAGSATRSTGRRPG
jgi:hypothetical protein